MSNKLRRKLAPVPRLSCLCSAHSLLWPRGVEVAGEEMPDFGVGIETVEEVAAGRIGVNMEGEILAGGLQGVGEVLDFTESYVVVAGVGLDEQGGAQLLDIGCWRAAAILLGRFGDGLAPMIGSGEELLVVL